MSETVTAGPWHIESIPEDESFAEINGGTRSKARCDWYSLAKVVVRLDGNDSQEGRANLNLIITAVNSCFKCAPGKEQAFAEAIPEMVRQLKELEYAITYEVNEKGGGGYILARLSDLRDLLTRLNLSAKKEEDHD